MRHQSPSHLLRLTAKLLRIGYAFVIAAAGLVLIIGLLRLVFGYHSSVYAPPLPAAADGGFMPGLSAVPLLLVYAWFVRNLQRIVETAAAGAPFVPGNAARLTRMGWVALVLKLFVWSQAVLLHAGAGWARLQPRVEAPNLLLIVGLFILAEVFRQGAALQGDHAAARG